MIDAADLGKKPGTIVLLKPEETVGISFSTHSLPPRIMTDYLLANLDCEIIIIGIQPKRIDFGSSLSKEVEKSAKHISDAIKAVITYNN
jgi:Ni,Fe-hydrogenase maturation factor